MVVIVTPYFEKLSNNKYFSKAIKGILSSFVGLLLFVSVQFGLNVSWNLISILIAVAAFIALLTKVKIHWIILVTILISIFIL
jgi:chromate transport protein ChrA